MTITTITTIHDNNNNGNTNDKNNDNKNRQTNNINSMYKTSQAICNAIALEQVEDSIVTAPARRHLQKKTLW